MDTVCNFKDLPFELKFITEYIKPIECNATKFLTEECTFLKQDIITATIEENDDVSLLFNCADMDARLYMEALDSIPTAYGLETDDEGNLFRKPSVEPIPLYRNGDKNFYAIRVGLFKIVVVCNQIKYYGTLQVKPKHFSNNEWEIMKNDLESEIRGLAQDLIRKNIGLGGNEGGDLPPHKLYKFFIIKKYASAVLSALIDIKDKPRCAIKKEYQLKPSYKAKNIDSVTIKRYLTGTNINNKYYVPVKTVDYDLIENRLLKKILYNYEKELANFIVVVTNVINYYDQNEMPVYANNNYSKAVYIKELKSFLAVAEKLKKITNIIKMQSWFSEISESYDGTVCHSVFMDSRYSILFKLYRQLKKEEFSIEIDPMYSYAWKISSNLYEMWCFIKICRVFMINYELISKPLWTQFNSVLLFPFLPQGTTLSFLRGSIRIDVIYDKTLPTAREKTSLEERPFYISNREGMRPDIVVNLYDTIKNMYIGSIVLECKYRKIYSFWSNFSTSSKEQIIAYEEKSRSSFYLNLPAIAGARPVIKVLVLNPDFEEKTKEESRILLCPLRPQNDDMLNSVFAIIDNVIDLQIKEVDAL